MPRVITDKELVRKFHNPPCVNRKKTKTKTPKLEIRYMYIKNPKKGIKYIII